MSLKGWGSTQTLKYPQQLGRYEVIDFGNLFSLDFLKYSFLHLLPNSTHSSYL